MLRRAGTTRVTRGLSPAAVAVNLTGLSQNFCTKLFYSGRLVTPGLKQEKGPRLRESPFLTIGICADSSAQRKLLFRGFGLLCDIHLGILAGETLHPAGRIHQLLLSGKEGMATGADLHADVAPVRGTCGGVVSAG